MRLPSALMPCLLVLACQAPAAPAPRIEDEPVKSTHTLGEQACLAGGLQWEVHHAPALLAAYVARLEDLGATAVRLPIDWTAIEATKGTYDTSVFEPIVAALEAAHVRPIALLGYGHPAYNGRTDGDRFYPALDPADFGRYAGAVARAFGTRLAAYEIWNEPNAGYRFFKPAEDPARYAAQLAAAERAIHEACPDCRVLFGGVFWHRQVIMGGVDFIRESLEAAPGLTTRLDGLALHPYARYPPVAAPDDAEGQEVPLATMISQAVHAAGPLPVWLTETGWPVQPQLDAERQAAMLMKSAALAARADVEVHCWYELENGPRHGLFPPEHDFGLLEYSSDGPAAALPKPAYGAFRAIGRRLGPLAFSRDRTTELGLTRAGDAAFLFRSRDGSTAATIVWSTLAPPGTHVRWAVHEGARVEALDHAGRPIESEVANGQVSMPVGDDPVVVIETR